MAGDPLHRIASALAERAARLGLKRLKSNAKPDKWGGRHIGIALWQPEGVGKLTLMIFRGNYLDTGPVFWIGFYANSTRAIDSLYAATTHPEIERFDWSKSGAEDEYVRVYTCNKLNKTGGFTYEVNDAYFGKYFFAAENKVLREATQFIDNMVQELDPDLPLRTDIAALADLKRTDPTEYRKLVSARRGQGQFRKELDNLWSHTCAVTGCRTREVLRASHIKPWSTANTIERLDPANGILLNATLDALFDRGLVSFDDAGKLLISTKLVGQDRKLLGLAKSLSLKEPPGLVSAQKSEYLRKRRQYLKAHRKASERYWSAVLAYPPSS